MNTNEEIGLAELAAVVREQRAAMEEMAASLSTAQAYQIAIQAAFGSLALALQERGYINGSEIADALRQVRSTKRGSSEMAETSPAISTG